MHISAPDHHLIVSSSDINLAFLGTSTLRRIVVELFQFTDQFFVFIDQTQLLDTTQIGPRSWGCGHRCATSRMQMAVGRWRCKCHWWKGQSYQRRRRDNLVSLGSVINEEVPRFLFGVRRGVTVSGRIELAAKLMTDASSWKFDNGWRRFAAKENNVFSHWIPARSFFRSYVSAGPIRASV